MKLRDILPSSDDLKRMQGVEADLFRRRRTGSVAGVIAILGATAQLVFQIAKSDYFENLLNLIRSAFDSQVAGKIDPSAFIVLVISGIAIVTYFLLRRTSVLFKESREPFRYTFWVEPFTLVEGTPGTRFPIVGDDRFKLLNYDLCELLNERIKRFSLLKEYTGKNDKEGRQAEYAFRVSPSHIHISGQYAIREEEKDQWIIHVMPTIRLGPSGANATLAHPIRYPLRQRSSSAYPLTAEEYLQIVERVYSRIATEIYDRIETDVQEKIKLFPTSSLRSVAYFYEAEDFARSNTIDAYQRSIDLYRKSLKRFGLWRSQTVIGWFLRRRIFWRLAIRIQHRFARVVIGYVKCLIYRREISALSGRYRYPLYRVPEILCPVIRNLRLLQEHLSKPCGEDSNLIALSYPDRSWKSILTFRPDEGVFKQQREVLFQAYLVESLTHHLLGTRKLALQSFQEASRTAPDRIKIDPLYLLVQGVLESSPAQAILSLQAATEFAPDFQIASWFLAQRLEFEFKDRGELVLSRARVVLDGYQEVLKINPGNIAALAAQGYIYWLVCRPDDKVEDNQPARRKFEEGREVKAIARETFIGQLNYGLARIAAESGRFDECFQYLESVATDPSIAAFSDFSGSRGTTMYYEAIGRGVLGRFRCFKERVESLISRLERLPGGRWRDTNIGETFSDKTIRTVYSFVLNDYGNACLNFFHRFGDREQLNEAISAYEHATRENRDNAVAWFGLRNAYSWSERSDEVAGALERVKLLAPRWPIAAYEYAMVSTTDARKQVDVVEKQIKEARAAVEKAAETFRQAQKDYGLEKTPVSQGSYAASGLAEQGQLNRFVVTDDALRRFKEQFHQLDISRQLEPMKNKVFEDARAFEKEVRRLVVTPRLSEREMAELRKVTRAISLRSASIDASHRSRVLSDEEKQLRLAAERLSQAEKSHKDMQKKLEDLETSRDEIKKKLAEQVKSAIELIGSTCKFSSLFDKENHRLTVDRLIRQQWKHLETNDVEAMVALAGVLANGSTDEKDLLAAKHLTAHILDHLPEHWDGLQSMAKVLFELKARPGNSELNDLIKEEKDYRVRIIQLIEKKEIHNDSSMFASLYWLALMLYPDIENFKMHCRELVEKPENERVFNFIEGLDERRPDSAKQLENVGVYHFIVGRVFQSLGLLNDALAEFETCVKKTPGQALYHFALGTALRDRGDLGRARDEYSKAFRLSPERSIFAEGLADCINRLGVRKHNAGDYGQAADFYRHAITLNPHKSLYHQNLAVACEASWNEDRRAEARLVRDAASAAMEAHRLDPSDVESADRALKLQRKLATIETLGRPAIEMYPIITPTAIEVGPGLQMLTQDGSKLTEEVERRDEKMRTRLQELFGMKFQKVRVRETDTLPAGTYIIMIMETPLVSGNVSTDKLFCPITLKQAQEHGIESGSKGVNPCDGTEGCWISMADRAKALALDIDLWDWLEYILRHLMCIVEMNAVEYLGHQEVFGLLEEHQDASLREFAESDTRLSDLTEVLRGLVIERVPIRALEEIVGQFRALREENFAGEIIEAVRMMPIVKRTLPGNDGTYNLFVLGKRFEEAIRESIYGVKESRVLAMLPEKCQECLVAVRNSGASLPKGAVVVRDPNLRPFVRKLIELEFPRVPVLSERELSERIRKETITEVDL
jgi:tetratricopeptide (TPR) repeat protein